MAETVTGKEAVGLLLEDNRRAMKALHLAGGFDFEKEFYIVRHDGKRFTLNNVLKEVDKAKVQDAKIFIVIIYDGERRSSCNYTYFAKVNQQSHLSVYTNTRCIWDYDIDSFYSLKRLNEFRTIENYHYYIVAQNNKYIISRKHITDPFGRYRFGDGAHAAFHYYEGYRLSCCRDHLDKSGYITYWFRSKLSDALMLKRTQHCDIP